MAKHFQLCHFQSMRHSSHLRWLCAWIAILGMLSSPLAAAPAMAHGSKVALTELHQQASMLAQPGHDADACCVTHQSGKTLDDCGTTACVSAASCMAKCAPGTAQWATKPGRDAFDVRFLPFDETTAALYGPEPPIEPPRS